MTNIRLKLNSNFEIIRGFFSHETIVNGSTRRARARAPELLAPSSYQREDATLRELGVAACCAAWANVMT